uniref:Tetraspanin n=1 Tax=Macrostomum lignano TaxID=282301 RepID=A0A1I8FUB0_9PLAT
VDDSDGDAALVERLADRGDHALHVVRVALPPSPILQGDASGTLVHAEERRWPKLLVAHPKVLVQVVQPIEEVAQVAAENAEDAIVAKVGQVGDKVGAVCVGQGGRLHVEVGGRTVLRPVGDESPCPVEPVGAQVEALHVNTEGVAGVERQPVGAEQRAGVAAAEAVYSSSDTVLHVQPPSSERTRLAWSKEVPYSRDAPGSTNQIWLTRSSSLSQVMPKSAVREHLLCPPGRCGWHRLIAGLGRCRVRHQDAAVELDAQRPAETARSAGQRQQADEAAGYRSAKQNYELFSVAQGNDKFSTSDGAGVRLSKSRVTKDVRQVPTQLYIVGVAVRVLGVVEADGQLKLRSRRFVGHRDSKSFVLEKLQSRLVLWISDHLNVGDGVDWQKALQDKRMESIGNNLLRIVSQTNTESRTKVQFWQSSVDCQGASGGCSEEAEETAHSASPWRPMASSGVAQGDPSVSPAARSSSPTVGKNSARPVSLMYRASSGMLSGLQTSERSGFGPSVTVDFRIAPAVTRLVSRLNNHLIPLAQKKGGWDRVREYVEPATLLESLDKRPLLKGPHFLEGHPSIQKTPGALRRLSFDKALQKVSDGINRGARAYRGHIIGIAHLENGVVEITAKQLIHDHVPENGRENSALGAPFLDRHRKRAAVQAASACLIVVGAVVWHGAGSIDSIAKSTYALVPTVIILGSGIFLFLLGVIGCFACINENRCLLSTFFILLLLILLGEITAATMGIVYHGQVRSAIDTELNKELQSYHNDSLLKSEVDFIQSTYQCCGVNNFTDWLETPWSRQHNLTVPGLLLPRPPLQRHGPDLFHSGCLSKLNYDFSRFLGLIAAFSLVVAILQALGLLASCVLMCRERRSPTYQRFGEQEGGRHV